MAQVKWSLDPTHSELNFKVKHLMISNVKGSFNKFNSEVVTEDDNFNHANVLAQVDIASIFTNNEDRDNHLRSADFFDAEQFPEMKFESKDLVENNGDYQLLGDLTIKGITKPVAIDVEFGGVNQDPWGNTKAGFSFKTQINRKEFGLTWNATLETGGVMVGEDIKIDGEVQFVKQQA